MTLLLQKKILDTVSNVSNESCVEDMILFSGFDATINEDHAAFILFGHIKRIILKGYVSRALEDRTVMFEKWLLPTFSSMWLIFWINSYFEVLLGISYFNLNNVRRNLVTLAMRLGSFNVLEKKCACACCLKLLN